MAPEEARAAHADRPGTFRERLGDKPIQLGPDHPVRAGPSDEQQRADEHQHARVGRHERLDEDEGDERRGNGRHQLCDRLSEQPRRAPPAPEREDEDAGGHAREPCEQHDRQRRPRTSEHQAEQVPAEQVRAEGEHEAWVVGSWIGSVLDEEVDRLVRSQALAQQRGDEQPDQGNQRADHQGLETRERKRPEPPVPTRHVKRRRDWATHGPTLPRDASVRHPRGLPDVRLPLEPERT